MIDSGKKDCPLCEQGYSKSIIVPIWDAKKHCIYGYMLVKENSSLHKFLQKEVNKV